MRFQYWKSLQLNTPLSSNLLECTLFCCVCVSVFAWEGVKSCFLCEMYSYLCFLAQTAFEDWTVLMNDNAIVWFPQPWVASPSVMYFLSESYSLDLKEAATDCQKDVFLGESLSQHNNYIRMRVFRRKECRVEDTKERGPSLVKKKETHEKKWRWIEKRRNLWRRSTGEFVLTKISNNWEKRTQLPRFSFTRKEREGGFTCFEKV